MSANSVSVIGCAFLRGEQCLKSVDRLASGRTSRAPNEASKQTGGATLVGKACPGVQHSFDSADRDARGPHQACWLALSVSTESGHDAVGPPHPLGQRSSLLSGRYS